MTVLSDETDLNTVVAKNDYTGKTLVNIPEEVPSYAWCNISVRPFANNEAYICQTLTTSVLNKEFMRVCHNGVWTAWDSYALNSDLSSKIFVENHTLSFIDGKCDISGGNHFIVSVTPIGTEITASIALVDLPNTYRVILSNSTWNNELACQITYTAKG